MKKFLITCLLLFCTHLVFAEQVKFDTTGWTIDDINTAPAAISVILSEQSISYDAIKVIASYAFDIVNPSRPVADILTTSTVKLKIDDLLRVNNENTQDAKDYDALKAAELENNEFAGLKMDEAQAIIMNSKDLEDLKVHLGNFVRYENAKE